MTKIIYKTGDLLQAEERVIIHGCNAQGAMNSGVAKGIRQRWPEAWDAYRVAHERNGLQVGQIVRAVADTDAAIPKVIINAITQQFYGRDPNRVYVSYDGLRMAFKAINAWCFMIDEPFAMPLIGAGLANGDWKIIANIIEQEATLFQPVVYTLDGKVPL